MRPAEKSPPALPLRTLETTDVDEYALAFRRWDHRFQQLGRGPFRGRLTFAEVGGVQVLRAEVNRIVLVQGQPPADHFVFSAVGRGTRGAVFRGRHLSVGQLNTVSPADEIDHRTSADYDMVALVVPGAALRRAAEAVGFDADRMCRHRVAFDADPRATAALDAHLRGVLDGLAAGLAAAPDALAAGCVARLARLVARGRVNVAEAVAPPTARQLVACAEAVVRTAAGRLPSAYTLANELDVSERTLRYAFREVRGVGPMTYFKLLRLNAVRRELKRPAALAATVRTVADRWGFSHPGEFAADYRRLFGELPSQTLHGLSRA